MRGGDHGSFVSDLPEPRVENHQYRPGQRPHLHGPRQPDPRQHQDSQQRHGGGHHQYDNIRIC